MEYRNTPKSKLELDPARKCVKCGSNNVISLGVGDDWQCNDCLILQLSWLKVHGYRLYAFLLAGSWTSCNFYAKNHLQAYREACKKYGKDNVRTAYLRGAVDCYVMTDWIGFNLYN